ncbi:chromosome segregation protein SMC [Cephaloticoccus capnophilus]|uniref:Chromosome partition protein Smc n=1 Tax=Cephaloticoccus capnophilus TaxID=1548208 RepID=A0A139SN35_9BACT|nr:chromosome segregation protein SMC [Cephaloticoccus capnophilus]KXU36026.1 chromosome segregation protein SMC [Cephaloticoccus capnophilus]
MYLKALKLHGFKSFSDPTTLNLEPGVTAVVGPNGCGKSNIADAIRWVLGEQSAKALRGGKMQDVIFEGSDARKAAQLCEVSLLLTDCEKQLGSEFHEIEIMRRVHRDGASEYFFNGRACRLKDIHKLFMDTGVGRMSYSIMAQGQIDQILSSKPEERRAVFEEAAGITKYKAQRREALGKLALTDQNLSRVADVVGEVSRQIGSLRRQAAKALRYKRLNHRMRHLALAWNSHQHAALSATLGELDVQVTALRAQADTRRRELESQQGSLDEKKAARAQLNQRVQDAQQAAYDLRSQKEAAENQANLAQTKRSGLEDRLTGSRNTLGELEMQLREVSEQADTGAQDKQQQLTLLGSSDDVFQQCNRELGIVEGELSKVEEQLRQAKFALLQTESSVTRLRADCSRYEVDQKTSAHRHETLAAELAQAREQSASSTQRVAELDTRVAEASTEKTKATESVAAAQQRIAALTSEFREAQRKQQEIDRALAQRSARLRLLQQLQEKWEGFGEGAKAILQGRLNKAFTRAGEGPQGSDVTGETEQNAEAEKPLPITQGLEVRPAHARAIEALLGAAAEAIRVSDTATAQRVLAQLEAESLGAAVLHVGDFKGRGDDVASQNKTACDCIKAASEALIAPEPGHPALSILSACYITDDLPAFLDYWKANPEFSFLAVASAKGELVDRRGLIYGGTSKKPANSIVQREIDLRETAKALAEEQKAHDAQKAVIEKIAASLAEAEAALEQARSAVLAATQQLAQAQAEQRSATQASEEVARRIERMTRELGSLEQASREAQLRWEKAQAALAEAEAAVQSQRDTIQSAEARSFEVRTSRDAKREALAQARLDLAEHRQKVEVLDRGLGEMQRRRQQLEAVLKQRRDEIGFCTTQIADLEKEAATAQVRAKDLEASLATAQQQVETLRVELVELERVISQIEGTQHSERQQADAAQSELGRHEVKLAELRQRVAFLVEEVQREFSIEIGEVDWRLSLWRADDEPEGIQALDLDEEDEGGQPSEAATPQSSEAAAETEPEGEGSEAASGAAAAVAPKRRRKKKEQRGEPTEADLAALDATDWAAVKHEADALRQRLGSLGAVNLVAIEEYAELKERHDFLKKQVADLSSAKAELLGAIDEINQTSRQQFELTFEQIRKNFAGTFQTLFGGGRAELELIETDDILESGIEIVAQPPGTKLKSITLLSGGQKTLTAVALLFALYMVKPSPFCLLDELDAPLDESNIGRFTTLLKQFVDNSQFIIITHNKRTVSAAQAIYGVTMEERGVSKIVSMRFSHHPHSDGDSPQPANIAEAVVAARAGQ